MGDVRVVDRGQREIVVFLAGAVDGTMRAALDRAVEEVDALEHLNLLDRAIVDMHAVETMDSAGIDFLHALAERGRRHGFDLQMSALSGAAHRALEHGGWSFAEHSPPSPADR